MAEQYVSFSAAWFTLSLINAGLAQSKNRGGLRWWLASLFIGPLATLLIVAWPSLLPGGSETPPRTMTQRQALGLGIVILLVFGLLVAIGTFFANVWR